MNRIAQTFQRLAQDGRKALIPYFMAGDPAADATVSVMHALVEGGADIIELGVPFSDPMADGLVIQQAAERALARKVSLAQVLRDVATFRQQDAVTPVVLMGYANPIERYEQVHGAGRFAQDAKAAGVDGLLVVDYPPEEVEIFAEALKKAGIDLIFLLAPTSTPERMAQVGRIATGYVYYVSLTGVTGAGHLDTGAVAQKLPTIRHHVRVPVGVGFGIRDAQSARAVGQAADAVVIGSRIVQLLQEDAAAGSPMTFTGLKRFVQEIRSALDA